MPRLSSLPPNRQPPSRVAPAGAVPATGSPSASYATGVYDFESHVLVVGPEPIINAGAFPSRFAETIAELIAGATSQASGNSIVRGAQQTTGVSAFLGVAPRWWVTIRGRFTAPATWQTAALNRAIARAFANVTTWRGVGTVQGRPVPPANDGSMLLAALSRPDACTGGMYPTQTFAAACTRVGLAQTMTPIAPPPGSSTTPYGTPAQREAARALNAYVASAPPGSLIDANGEPLYDDTVARYESAWARTGLGYYDAEVQAQMVKLGVPLASIAQARPPVRTAAPPPPTPLAPPPTTPRPPTTAQPPLPATQPESRITKSTTPTQIVPQPPARPQGTSATPYVVGAVGLAAIGVAYWQRKAIVRLFR